jgi:hypothetical protein
MMMIVLCVHNSYHMMMIRGEETVKYARKWRHGVQKIEN